MDNLDNNLISFDLFDESWDDFMNDNKENEADDSNIGQNSDVAPDKSELLNYIKGQQNKNTVRKTQNDALRFTQWLKDHPRSETRPVHTLEPEILDNYVGQYLLSVKRKDGTDYEPDTLTSIHRSIDRYLKELGYGHSLVTDKAFETSKKVLESKRKALKKDGHGNRELKADPLSPDEENVLWDKGQLGSHEPAALQRALWFLTTKLMGKFDLLFQSEHKFLRSKISMFNLQLIAELLDVLGFKAKCRS